MSKNSEHFENIVEDGNALPSTSTANVDVLKNNIPVVSPKNKYREDNLNDASGVARRRLPIMSFKRYRENAVNNK